VSPATIRVLLLAAALYLVIKTVTAPKRGTFLTLFGNIRRDTQPRAFMVCLVAGYALACLVLLAVILPDAWLPLFLNLQTT
jgi:hypothetical protein